MTRTSNEHLDDPAHRWANLLEGLHGRRRGSVEAALRASVEQGHPASSEGVRLLVSYALGQISARQYAADMLDSLGFMAAPTRTTSVAEELPELATWRPAERRRSTWQEPQRVQSAAHQVPRSALLSRVPSREETIRAYMSGRIPVEEFLRRSRVRTA